MASVINKVLIADLIALFLKKGGRIHKYYLQNPQKSRQTLVHLNGWFSGHNIREAILKALAGQ